MLEAAGLQPTCNSGNTHDTLIWSASPCLSSLCSVQHEVATCASSVNIRKRQSNMYLLPLLS